MATFIEFKLEDETVSHGILEDMRFAERGAREITKEEYLSALSLPCHLLDAVDHTTMPAEANRYVEDYFIEKDTKAAQRLVAQAEAIQEKIDNG